MQYRVCSSCYVEKPLTPEFFGPQKNNWSGLHTYCRACKKEYLKQWQLKRKLSRDPEEKRKKKMYEIKEPTQEEVRIRMEKAYSYIYLQAFEKEIPLKVLKKLDNDNT